MARRENVVKICPPADTFVDVERNVKCPIENCDKILSHTGALRLHVAKTHGQKEENGDGKKRDVCKEYHCPINTCVYNINSERHFSSMGLLKQHYRKVHAEKKYKCEKCSQGFGVDRDRLRHQDRCGIIYKCGTCQCPYTTTEAVLTHCRRKNHQLPQDIIQQRERKESEKIKGKKTACNGEKTVANSAVSQNSIIFINVQCTPVVDKILPNLPQYKPIHPKPLPVQVPFITPAPHSIVSLKNYNSQNIYINKSPIENSSIESQNELRETFSQGIQTTEIDSNPQPKTKLSGNVCNTGIQTAVTFALKKKSKAAAHTQTSAGDHILQTAMASAKIPIKKASVQTQVTPRSKGKRHNAVCSSETQTFDVTSVKRRKRRQVLGQRTTSKMDSMSQTIEDQMMCNMFNANSSDATCQTRNSDWYQLMNDFTCQTGIADMTSTCVQTNVMVDNISQTISPRDKNLDSFISASSVTGLMPNFQSYVNVFEKDSSSVTNYQVPSLNTICRQGKTDSSNSNTMVTIPSNLVLESFVPAAQTDRYLGKTLHPNSASENPLMTPLADGFEPNKNLTNNIHAASNFSGSLVESVQNAGILENNAQSTEIVVSDNQHSMRGSASQSIPAMPNAPKNNSILIISNKPDYEKSTNLIETNPSMFQNSLIPSADQNKGRKCSISTNTSVFDQRLTSDSQVQTLSSASDIDFLLDADLDSSIGHDMHTQTTNHFDMFDILVNDIETQTPTTNDAGETATSSVQIQTIDEDILFLDMSHKTAQTNSNTQTYGSEGFINNMQAKRRLFSSKDEHFNETPNGNTFQNDIPNSYGLDTFSLSDIHTQTVFDLNSLDYQTTASTQTSQNQVDVQLSTGTQCESDLTDMETQTPFPGLFSFSVTNTCTQTIEDLDLFE